MGSVPNCQKEIPTRHAIRWFKCKLKPPKNDSEIPFRQKRGQPIAQLILEKSDTPPVERVDTLPPTERGSRDFGQQTAVTYGATARAPGKLPESTYH